MVAINSQIRENFADSMWRMCNLYWILDKDGQEIQFSPNEVQLKFLSQMHTQNVILKARQRGFSTVIQLFLLDQAVFYPNIRAGVIAHTLEDVEIIFRDKIKFAYDRLPEAIRRSVRVDGDSKRELVFSNGSSVRVGMSMRSGTLQYLHVSEFGKICSRYPEKAREILTGSLPTVQAGNFWFVESTAEGSEGAFHDMCQKSQARALIDRPLSVMEPRFHFASWWDADEYQIDPEGVVISPKEREYFESIESKIGAVLAAPRRAWYVLKTAEVGGHENMLQEYPSLPEEAFMQSTEGAYYTNQMATARKSGRVLRIPKISGPVNTFWDVGNSDGCAIWFHQSVGMEDRFIGYYEAHGEDLTHYVKVLQDTGFIWNKHYLPHDADHARLTESNRSIKQMLEGLGLRNIEIVPRIDSIQAGIQMVRQHFPSAFIDEQECVEGIKRLENYKKRWNPQQGRWSDEPKHDANSEGADAFRQWAQAKDAGIITNAGGSGTFKRSSGGWRVS